MNVLVIGAAGKTGSAVVEQALTAGHQVTAFVHQKEGYDAPENVRVVEGDATDPATVAAAVAGQDAVLDTIGAKHPTKPRRSNRALLAPLSRPCSSTARAGWW